MDTLTKNIKRTKKLNSFIYILLLSVFILFNSCSATKKWRRALEKEWIGKTKSELVQAFGEPTQINIDSSPGNEIYIYKHIDYTPDIPPNNYTKDFFINKDDLIFKIETYSW